MDHKLNNIDMKILLKEHQFYRNALYFGNDEYQYEAEDKHIYNIKMHESQQMCCKSKTYEKWIDVFLFEFYPIKCVVYIVDLSLFKNSHSNDRMVIRHWINNIINISYFPVEIENVIIKYIVNPCFLNDIDRFHRVKDMEGMQHGDYDLVLLFVNYNIFCKYITKDRLDELRSFFPDFNVDDILATATNDDDINESVLSIIRNLYFEDFPRPYSHVMNELEPQLTHIWKEIRHMIIYAQLRQGGLIG